VSTKGSGGARGARLLARLCERRQTTARAPRRRPSLLADAPLPPAPAGPHALEGGRPTAGGRSRSRGGPGCRAAGGPPGGGAGRRARQHRARAPARARPLRVRRAKGGGKLRFARIAGGRGGAAAAGARAARARAGGGGSSSMHREVDWRAARCAAASGSALVRTRMPGRNKAERGCLYKLEVTNFKSYGGTLTIGPFKDFTCVIGPNGSGAVLARRPCARETRAFAPPPAPSAFAGRAVSRALLPRALPCDPRRPLRVRRQAVGWGAPTRLARASCCLPRAGFYAACPPAGKSNLMDAVSFVMGVNTKDLRGAKVADFRIHGAGKSDANTSVTLYHRDTSRRSLPSLPAVC